MTISHFALNTVLMIELYEKLFQIEPHVPFYSVDKELNFE
nr:hypothetical protein [Vibrio cholerae]